MLRAPISELIEEWRSDIESLKFQIDEKQGYILKRRNYVKILSDLDKHVGWKEIVDDMQNIYSTFL